VNWKALLVVSLIAGGIASIAASYWFTPSAAVQAKWNNIEQFSAGQVYQFLAVWWWYESLQERSASGS
jgi:hypothetical protein